MLYEKTEHFEEWARKKLSLQIEDNNGQSEVIL